MTYKDFVKKQFETNGWIKTAENFKELDGKKVLIFTHDDPDGISTGCILKHLVESMGGITKIKLPASYELSETELMEELENDNYSMVIVADKGTIGYYDDYVDKVDKFVVIDHHPPIGEIKKCNLINPNISGYNFCSTSYLAHMLVTYLGRGNKYDDFLALIGLKGDWAVEPATDIVSEYVKDFYSERIETGFGGYIEKIVSRPTMFEVNQKEKTTLINQITELYFALGGGGFQYFYNARDEKLRTINQAEFSFNVMAESYNDLDFDKIKNIEDYISSTADPEMIKLIYGYFFEDWDKAMQSFSSATPLTVFDDTVIYLFTGYSIPLMPMAGSVYLSELKRDSSGKEVLFIMINKEKTGEIHCSIRGTADKINAGKVCNNLAKRLVSIYGNGEQITGGGHYRAAECRTRRSGVSLAGVLNVFSELIMEMEDVCKEGNTEEGLELGMEFLKREI